MIVIGAGLVLVGASTVGGIAFAASRTSESPSMHPQTTLSPGDRDNEGNKQDSDDDATTPRAGATCAPDNDADDATTGEREGSPAASRTPEGDDIHRGGTAAPNATGTHHPGADEAPEATRPPQPSRSNDADHRTTGSSCDDD
jgi:hypothetical protein